MRKKLGILTALSLLATGCLFTSLHSPRAHKQGEVSAGVHLAAIVSDNQDNEEDDSDAPALVVGTARFGTELGEFGGSLSPLGFDGTFKYPLTSQDGATHVSFIAGGGAYLFFIPYANIGILAGQDFGPLTAYVGYRQHVILEGLYSGDMIAGVELNLFKEISIMAEVNYNYLFSDNLDSNQDLLNAFDIPVVSIGLNFGSGRKRPTAGTLQPVMPPPAPTGHPTEMRHPPGPPPVDATPDTPPSETAPSPDPG